MTGPQKRQVSPAEQTRRKKMVLGKTTFVQGSTLDDEEKIRAQAIVDAGGTISHQHGVGRDHAPYLGAEKSALERRALAAAFTEFDPEGMMNPQTLPEFSDVD